MHPRRRYALRLRGKSVVLGERTWVMGIVNVTPDSFSDGGRFAGSDAAVAQGLALFEAGADIVDVGGESTRPGASPVDPTEERRRVIPVLDALRRAGAGYLSIDTSKADVARAALEAGADVVNDVSGFTFDPEMAGIVAKADAPAVVMHLRGDFGGMHQKPQYRDVVQEVSAELAEALARGEAAGIAREQMIVDPGIGFSKTAEHSLTVLQHLSDFSELGRPLLVGPSRKSFLADLVVRRDERLWGTAAAVAACTMAGAHIVRVHDVREMKDVARVCDAIRADASPKGTVEDEGGGALPRRAKDGRA